MNPTTDQKQKVYPMGMRIPGRVRCNYFLVKYIHNVKTGKFNWKQYNCCSVK